MINDNYMTFKNNLFRKFSGDKLLIDFGIIDWIDALALYINTPVEEVGSASYNIASLEIEDLRPVVGKKEGACALDMHYNKVAFKPFEPDMSPLVVVFVHLGTPVIGVIAFDYKYTIGRYIVVRPANHESNCVVVFLFRDIECPGNNIDNGFFLLRYHPVFKGKLNKLKEDYHPFFQEKSLLYLPADICYLK